MQQVVHRKTTRVSAVKARSVRQLVEHALAAVGLAVLYLTLIPQPLGWWIDSYAVHWGEPRGDILIVLAGDVSAEGTLGWASYRRVVTAVDAWRAGNFRKVVISGGSPGGFSISEPMRDFMVCRGVPSAAITLENRSISTRENAVNVAALLAGDPGRKVLMTSDYHMLRAMRCFQHVGVEVFPYPVNDAGLRFERKLERWEVLIDMMRESVKTGFYSLKSWA